MNDELWNKILKESYNTSEDMQFECYENPMDDFDKGKNAGVEQCKKYFERFITNLKQILNDEAGK